MSFFAPPDLYPAAGMFGVGHAVLLLVALLFIGVALFASRGLDEGGVRSAVRGCTLALLLSEGAKIIFVLFVVKTRNPNEFVPLYYCSITLYAGLFSSFGKGKWRRVGDVFLATGGVFGGATFLLFPLTSLSRYPALHFISIHSFLLHALMVYLGALLFLCGVYRPRKGDMLYNALPVSVTCAVAFLFNAAYDHRHPLAPVANLMFVSKDFPGTPISLVYQLCGPLYPVVAWLGQAFLPFLAVNAVQRAILSRRAKRG